MGTVIIPGPWRLFGVWHGHPPTSSIKGARALGVHRHNQSVCSLQSPASCLLT